MGSVPVNAKQLVVASIRLTVLLNLNRTKYITSFLPFHDGKETWGRIPSQLLRFCHMLWCCRLIWPNRKPAPVLLILSLMNYSASVKALSLNHVFSSHKNNVELRFCRDSPNYLGSAAPICYYLRWKTLLLRLRWRTSQALNYSDPSSEEVITS